MPLAWGRDAFGMAQGKSIFSKGVPGTFGKVQVDSTAQEKNITFPTDAKLRKRVIDKCNNIAKKENVIQRQTYKRVSKKLLRDSYFGHHPKRRKSAESARRKLKTIGGRLIRELERNLPVPCQRHPLGKTGDYSTPKS